MPYSEADFLRDTNVSRETMLDYQRWYQLLLKWNKKINLVSMSDLEDFWLRHALDSWQITQFVPKTAKAYIDLGSGAGFPGIALAIAAKQRADAYHVTLVESAGKKTSFLKAVIRELGLSATATSERAETINPAIYDVISARAFAPLDRLLNYAQPFWGNDTIGLYLKGQNVDQELTQANKIWNYNVETAPSLSSSTGRILKITDLTPR